MTAVQAGSRVACRSVERMDATRIAGDMADTPPTFGFGAERGAPIELSPGSNRVEEIRLMVSCGSYQDDLRDVAELAIDRIAHLLRWQLGRPYNLIYWDYRRDASVDFDPDHLADRSLRAVEQCDGVIAILGGLIPPTTRLEIRHVYDLALAGKPRELWAFADWRPSARGTSNPQGLVTRAQFLEEIQADYSQYRWCPPVGNELEFLAGVMTGVMPYLLTRAGVAFGPIGGSAE